MANLININGKIISLNKKIINIKQSTPVVSNNYGYLYNGYAAIEANFAPTGWRVPTLTDWERLASGISTAYDSGSGVWTASGGALKETGYTNWDSPNTSATNSTGFSAKGVGIRETNGTFSGLKTTTDFWSTTLIFTGNYNDAYLMYNTNSMGNRGTNAVRYGLSIRLIKTDSNNPTTLTDYDGNVYDCITIGSQVWIKQNWKCTHLSNGTLIPNVTDNTTWSNLTNMALCSYNNAGNI